MPHMLFRSPLTRWCLAGIGILSGVIFALGDGHKWRSTPSLRWLAHAPIPLQFWGFALIVYGLLLLPIRTRAIGYAMGAVLYAIFLASMLATIGGPSPKSIPALAGLLDCIAFHLFSIRTALATRFPI